MYGKFQDFLKTELQSIKDAGLYKSERIIVTPQDAEIKLATGETVLNFCANNYLGLSSNPTVIEGAKKALDNWTLKSLNSSERKIPFFTLLVSMPTVVYSNRYSGRKMLSFPTN